LFDEGRGAYYKIYNKRNISSYDFAKFDNVRTALRGGGRPMEERDVLVVDC
jgi:hypothetical protein